MKRCSGELNGVIFCRKTKRKENMIKQYLREFQIFEITTKLVIQRKKGAPVDFVCLATKK